MRITDVRSDCPLGRRYTSYSFTPDPGLMLVDGSGNLYAQISISAGQLFESGSAVVGNSAQADLSSTFHIVLNAPNTNGASAISVIKQNNTVIGYFCLTSENIATFSYDVRYDDLLSYQTLDPLVPSPDRRLVAYDFDGVEQGSYDLNQAPTNAFAVNAAVVLDYHRDQVLVFNTSNNTVSKRLTGNGPASTCNIYDSSLIRAATAIAYYDEDVLRIYDNTFEILYTLNIPNASDVIYCAGRIYCVSRDLKTVTSYAFNADTLALTDLQSHIFGSHVQSIAHNDTTVFVMSETELVDLTDNPITTFDDPARNSVIVNNVLYITHGFNNYISKINLSDSTVTRITIPEAIFLDTISVSPTGRVYVSDVEQSKIYVRDVSGQDWSVGYKSYGIIQSGNIYSVDLYDNIPSKIDIDGLSYELDTTAFTDIADFPLGDSGISGPIHVVTANKPIRIQLFPVDPDLQLYVNGLAVPDTYTIVQGDEIRVAFDYVAGRSDPLFFGVVIDQQLFDLSVYVDDSRIVPFDFKFNNRFGLPVASSITSNVITVSHLSYPVTVTLSEGELLVNGLSVGISGTISNGDTVAVRAITSADYCDTKVITVDVEGRFSTPFTITTTSDIPDSATLPRPNVNFTTIYDQPLGTIIFSDPITIPSGREPTLYEIPDIYDAQFYINGVAAGRSAVIRSNNYVQIALKTSFNYDTPHNVTISDCYGAFSFVAYTVGDVTPDAFAFGTLTGVSIKDYVSSQTVTLSGIGNSVQVPILIPYGVDLFVNGSKISTTFAAMDWRGVPLQDVFVMVQLSNNDQLQLRGYGRPVHGDTVNIPIYIGGRRGFWTVKTFDISQPVQHDLTVTSVARDAVAVYNTESVAVSSPLIAVTYSNQNKIVDQSRPEVVVSAVVQTAPTPAVVHRELREPNVDPHNIALRHNEIVQAERNVSFIQKVSKINQFDPSRDYQLAESREVISLPYNEIMYTHSNKLVYTDLIMDQFTVINSDRNYLDYDLEVEVVSPHAIISTEIAYAVTYSNQPVFATVIDRTIMAYVNSGSHVPQLESTYVVVKFDNKPFVYFDVADSLVWDFSTNPLFSWDTVVVWHQNPVISRNLDYINNDSKHWPLSDREFKAQLPHDPVYFESLYRYYRGVAPILFDHETVVQIARVNYVDPTYKVDPVRGTYPVVPSYRVESLADPVLVDRIAQIIPAPVPVYSDRSALVQEKTLDVYLESSDAVVNKNAAPVYIDMTAYSTFETETSVVLLSPAYYEDSGAYERTPPPNVLHPGYFATSEEAAANALDHDLVEGQFYPIYIEEKGWAWTRIIPCTNLCDPDKCPPSGYIHGG